MEISILRLNPATHLLTLELEQPQQPGDGRGGENGMWLKGLVLTSGSAPMSWRFSFHHATKQWQSKVSQCLRKRTPTGHSEDPPQGHLPINSISMGTARSHPGGDTNHSGKVKVAFPHTGGIKMETISVGFLT